jgi:hypothetical protein
MPLTELNLLLRTGCGQGQAHNAEARCSVLGA